MQPLSTPRLRRLNIRLSQQEWDQVKSLSSDTTCRNVSEYARLLLLDRPVRVVDSNSSLDNFEQLTTRLLAALDEFGDKLPSHESHARKIREIREAIARIAGQ